MKITIALALLALASPPGQHKTLAKPDTSETALIAKITAAIEATNAQAQHAQTLIAKVRAAIEAQNAIARTRH